MGVPDWDPIHRSILRATESDDAVCLLSEVDGVIIGFLLASIARHPAMPGVLGTLEEIRIRPGWEEAGVSRGRNHLGTQSRGQPDPDDGRVDSPWFDEELSFWRSIGFEHDQALVTRYFLGNEGS